MTLLARAFAHTACCDGGTALFVRAAELARQLAARADDSHSRLLYQLSRLDLLVADDFCMEPMTDGQRRDFLETCDTRCQTRSLLLTSQLPVANWHARMGLTRSSTVWSTTPRIELKGERMRRKRGPKARKENS